MVSHIGYRPRVRRIADALRFNALRVVEVVMLAWAVATHTEVSLLSQFGVVTRVTLYLQPENRVAGQVRVNVLASWIVSSKSAEPKVG